MNEKENIKFSHKEVAEALVKQQGIHEGEWMLSVQFGISGINAGPNDNELNPCALVPVLSIALSETDKVSNLSVNAAEVNPK